MTRQQILNLRLLLLLLGVLLTGCGGGGGPLKITKYSGTRGPWCAPNQRVQIGQRVVGKVAWGENRWKNFLVDDAGKEYDPEVVADQVWSYMERLGEAKRIMSAFHQDGQHTTMTVIALKPLVVVMATKPFPAGASRQIAAPERSYWVAQISSERDHPPYEEGLQWCSPDLKQKPTKLTFSKEGIAEIPLGKGKLKLVRRGQECQCSRE